MFDVNKIVKSDRCMFRGNVLLFFKQDLKNNSRVVSTGEENVFKIERCMGGHGHISECYVNMGGVANYYVEQIAMGATCEQNFIFPRALDDAVELCRKIYHDEVAPKLETKKLEERDKFVRDEILRSA